ncbi:Protein TIFY 5A, partial [Cucurbita argyrosperma subsp. argyrosperma]
MPICLEEVLLGQKTNEKRGKGNWHLANGKGVQFGALSLPIFSCNSHVRDPVFLQLLLLVFLITFMESGFWVFVYGCRMAMPLNHQKQIMVFNNGTASVCDLTELQVRAILGIASQERNSSKSQWWSNPERLSLQMPNGNAGFSIKKSLQRFLQRRNTRRIRSMYPYHKPRT